MIAPQALLLFLLCIAVACQPVAARSWGGSNPSKPLRIPTQEKGALQVFVSTIRNARHHLAAAAVARSVSILGMYPVDTIKVRRR
jgi:hypothetical protein